jgi:hypothetical protein
MTRSPRPSLAGVWRAAVACLVAACGLAACEEQASAPAEDLKAACKTVGQRCEFSPGKLGSCVVRDNCSGPSCFVCQSQH